MPVIGELYMVDDATMDRLDHVEGHPDFYKREKIKVYDSNGNEVECWAYIFPKEKLDLSKLEKVYEFN